uniref:VWA domain-containing protein n=1 Tax=Thermofilum pendens TaxID=2269 RepID=A0A7J3X9E8_THEPE
MTELEGAGVMITFGRPEALPLLILAAVPVVLHRRASARRAAALRTLGGRLPRLEWRSLGWLATLLLLVLAAAEPAVVRTVSVEVPLERAHLLNMTSVLHVVVLDVSRSMLEVDVPPNRCEAAKSFAAGYLGSASPADMAVLVNFSQTAGLSKVVPAREAASLVSNLTCGGRYSAVGDALAAALSVVRASGVPASVLLLTDGGWNYGSDPLEIAPSFKELGAALVVVRVGSDPRGAALLPSVAERAGGRYYELDAVSASIAAEVARATEEEGRYAALSARGLAKVDVVEREPLPAEALLLLAFAAAAALLRDGL